MKTIFAATIRAARRPSYILRSIAEARADMSRAAHKPRRLCLDTAAAYTRAAEAFRADAAAAINRYNDARARVARYAAAAALAADNDEADAAAHYASKAKNARRYAAALRNRAAALNGEADAAADTAARYARRADESAERAATAAAHQSFLSIAAADAAAVALRKAPLTLAERVQGYKADEARRAARAYNEQYGKEDAARAAAALRSTTAAAAARNEALVRKEDEEKRQENAAAAAALLRYDNAAPFVYTVSVLMPDAWTGARKIDYAAADAAARLAALIRPHTLYIEDVTANNAADAIRAALYMGSAERANAEAEADTDEARRAAWAVLSDAIRAAHVLTDAEADADTDEARRATAARNYNAAAAALAAACIVRANVKPVADDARALYRAAKIVTCAVTKAAYDSARAAASNAKKAEAEARRATAARENLLNDLYIAARRSDVLNMAENPAADILHNAAAALLAAEKAHAPAPVSYRLAYSAANAVLNSERVQGRHSAEVSYEALISDGFDIADNAAEDNDNAEASAAARRAMFAAAVLTDSERKAIYAGLRGMTTAESAAYMGVKSKGTVGDTRNRARAKLAAYVIAHTGDFSPAIVRACRAIIAQQEKRRAAVAAAVAANKAAKGARRAAEKK